MKYFIKILSLPLFWKFRSIFLRSVFQLKRIWFSISNITSIQIESAHVSRYLLKITIGSIVWALIFCITIMLIEFSIQNLWESNKGLLPLQIREIVELVPMLDYDNEVQNTVVHFLLVIASISGLILALFYPVLSTVASTAYSKVPTNIRYLLLSEPYSQKFVKQVAFLTAISFIIAAAVLFGAKPQLLVLGIIGLALLRSLFSLLRIGFGIFNFFDPSSLMDSLTTRMREITKNATDLGLYWKDINFQDYYRKQMVSYLDQLTYVLSLCANETHLRNTSFLSTTGKAILYLNWYSKMKQRIPSDSRWFPWVAKHASFFTASLTEQRFAKLTESYIQPKMVPDHLWIEKRILKYISQGANILQNDNDITTLTYTIALFDDYSKNIGESGDLAVSFQLMKTIWPLSIEMITKRRVKDTFDIDNISHEINCLIQGYSILENIGIGLFKNINNMKAGKFRELIISSLRNPSSIYDKGLPPKMVYFLESFSLYLSFERNVQGNVSTPEWYCMQSAASEYLKVIRDCLQEYLLIIQKTMIHTVEKLEKNKMILPSVIISQLGRHLSWKIESNFKIAQSRIDEYGQFRKQEKINWEETNINDLNKQVEEANIKFTQTILNNILILSTLRWSHDFVDVFGHCYNVACEEINEWLYDDNEIEIEKHFKQVIYAGLNASDKIADLAKHSDYTKEGVLGVSIQTIIDALQLSGLALVYSELYDKQLYRDICFDAWISILSKFKSIDEEKVFIERILASYAYYVNFQFRTGPGVQRQNYRERRLLDKFKRMGIIRGTRYSIPFMNDDDETIIHSSPTIRLIVPIGRMNSLHYKLDEIFIEIFLKSRIAAKNVTNLYESSFMNSLLREIKR